MTTAALRTTIVLTATFLAGCKTCAPKTWDYTPVDDGEWTVSTPAAQGLDAEAVHELYREASCLNDLYGVLLVKDGFLVAEAYFNEGSVDDMSNRQSVTKSVMSATFGVAVDQGLVELDQPLLDFFPELEATIEDPRKREVTVEHLLRMRGGYPWEEMDYRDALFTQEYVRQIVDLPLHADPGTRFQYSNMSSHWLSVIVERASGQETRDFAMEHLFVPLGIEEIGDWTEDKDGYDYGFAELGWRARDMARFGQMFLDGGVVDGEQVVPAEWVEASLTAYTDDKGELNSHRIGRNFESVGYGYQWWQVQSGAHRYWAALGHGGQQIVLLEELDLVVVVIADPQYLEWGGGAWRAERAHKNLVADWVATL